MGQLDFHLARRELHQFPLSMWQESFPQSWKIPQVTAPRSEDMNEMAKEYATALNRSVKYVDVPYDKWLKEELIPVGLSQYVFDHISTMAKLHAENRYDRLTSDVQKLTGKPSMSVREYVTAYPEVFSTAAVTR